MARPSMWAAPRNPWAIATLSITFLQASATGAHVVDDHCALVQTDIQTEAGAPPFRGAQYQMHLNPDAVTLNAGHSIRSDDSSIRSDDSMEVNHRSSGRLAWMTRLLTRLGKMYLGEEGPIDFGALLSNPKIINGLLSGDITKPVIELANEKKAPLPNDFRTTDLLQGHSLAYNNIAVLAIVGCIFMMPVIGFGIDRSLATGKLSSARRFSARIALLLVASYIIWIPAIFSSDFAFNIGFVVPITGQRVGITQDEHNGYKPGPIRESTRTLIHLLWSTGAHTGAVFIAIYAFAVPFLKLFLLGVGELFRFSKFNLLRRVARRSIIMMQFISKWAAPDMFAYVLLYYLIRKLQHLPVSTLCVFDIGFTCYSVFSLTCAMSSLGITLPQIGDGETEEVKPTMSSRIVGKGRVLPVAVALSVIWGVLFTVGLLTPCFALRLDAALLKDHVPNAMKTVLKMIKLDQIIAPQDVSLWRAMWALLGWFGEDRDLNLLLAFVMIAFFAVSLTVLNMAALLTAAWQLSREPQRGSKHPCPAISAAEVLKHISMLDVLIMGVIVSTCAGGMYKREGIVIYTLNGLFVLIAAEVVHYATYYTVHSVAEYEVRIAEKRGKIMGDGEQGKIEDKGNVQGPAVSGAG